MQILQYAGIKNDSKSENMFLQCLVSFYIIYIAHKCKEKVAIMLWNSEKKWLLLLLVKAYVYRDLQQKTFLKL